MGVIDWERWEFRAYGFRVPLDLYFEDSAGIRRAIYLYLANLDADYEGV